MPVFFQRRCPGIVVAAVQEAITGLDYDGTAGGTGPNYTDAATKRGWYLSSPPPMTPLTVFMKLLTRSQVGTVNRFHCACFYGNHGDFETFTDYARAYFGFHGYPRPDDTGAAKLEFAGGTGGGIAADKVTRDDSSTPDLPLGQFFSMAVVTSHVSSTWDQKLYCNLPSTSTANTISQQRDAAGSDVTPPTPVLMFGQTGSRVTAPSFPSSSWGNQIRWEELNGIMRGIQVYNEALTQAQIVARSTLEYNSQVLALNTADGITSLKYLCMNPTPSNGGINDYSGNGWHGTWDGASRPSLYAS